VQVWSTASKRQIRTIGGHTGGVWAMQFAGNRLVTGATDRKLHVYDLRTGDCVHQLRGHESTIRCLQVRPPLPYAHVTYKEVGAPAPTWIHAHTYLDVSAHTRLTGMRH
jgi:WD40 repeat protein